MNVRLPKIQQALPSSASVVAQIHDAAILEVPERHVEHVRALVKEAGRSRLSSQRTVGVRARASKTAREVSSCRLISRSAIVGATSVEGEKWKSISENTPKSDKTSAPASSRSRSADLGREQAFIRRDLSTTSG